MQTALFSLFSAQNGHFKFESGHHSNLWLDLDGLFVNPRQIQPFVVALARQLARHNINALCGPMLGGALIAQTIALELGNEFYYTERIAPTQSGGMYGVEYRLPTAQQKYIVGKRVAIVDDVISAGSAVRGTFAALQAAGAIPVVVGSLLVLNSTAPDYFGKLGISVECIAQQSSGFWSPEECPLCAAGIPLEDFTPEGKQS